MKKRKQADKCLDILLWRQVCKQFDDQIDYQLRGDIAGQISGEIVEQLRGESRWNLDIQLKKQTIKDLR